MILQSRKIKTCDSKQASENGKIVQRKEEEVSEGVENKMKKGL